MEGQEREEAKLLEEEAEGGNSYLLQMLDICKSFPGVKALQQPGQVFPRDPAEQRRPQQRQ